MIRILLLCCALLAAQALPAVAQKDPAQAAPAKTQAKKKSSHAAKKAEAPAESQAQAISTEDVQEEFSGFARTFVDKLNRVHENSITRMKVTKLDDGTYSARYHAIDPATIETSVKPTGHPASPFVGVLKYVENVYEARGATAQAAQTSVFNVVESLRVTELFARSKKGWE